jgi:hypothetical protein
MVGVHPALECGVLLSSLFEVNLLPSLGAVNGTDTLYAGFANRTLPHSDDQFIWK